MASTVAIAIMREQAMARLNAAAGRMLGARGLDVSPYDDLAKDPALAHAYTLDAIAGDLERLEAALSPPKDKAKR